MSVVVGNIAVNVTDISGKAWRGVFATNEMAQAWIDEQTAAGAWGNPGDFTVTIVDITADNDKLNQARLDREEAVRLAKLAINAINNAVTVNDLKPVLRNIVKYIALG